MPEPEPSNTGGATGGQGGTGNDDGSGGTAQGGAAGDGSGGTAQGGAAGDMGVAGMDSGSDVECPAQALPAGDTTVNLQVGGAQRSFVLHVPQAYDGSEPVPLIVDFHPLGGSGPAERNASPYPAVTDPEGVIMAFPSGLSGPSGGAWNVGPCCVANTDDVEFARALVQNVQESACIDPKRIYAVGFSMGGGMSHYVACHAADLFAAVSPAAFDLLDENIGTCNPERPITVVSFRSTGDSVVSYNGGPSSVVAGMPVTFLGAEATFEKWGELNECPGAPSAPDGDNCKTYSECAAGTQVTLCTTQGGGHDYGKANIAWPVLKQYTLP